MSGNDLYLKSNADILKLINGSDKSINTKKICTNNKKSLQNTKIQQRKPSQIQDLKLTKAEAIVKFLPKFVCKVSLSKSELHALFECIDVDKFDAEKLIKLSETSNRKHKYLAIKQNIIQCNNLVLNESQIKATKLYINRLFWRLFTENPTELTSSTSSISSIYKSISNGYQDLRDMNVLFDFGLSEDQIQATIKRITEINDIVDKHYTLQHDIRDEISYLINEYNNLDSSNGDYDRDLNILYENSNLKLTYFQKEYICRLPHLPQTIVRYIKRGKKQELYRTKFENFIRSYFIGINQGPKQVINMNLNRDQIEILIKILFTPIRYKIVNNERKLYGFFDLVNDAAKSGEYII